jgi:outer membrane protein OmpA-like peptidoglycan-associated protein
VKKFVTGYFRGTQELVGMRDEFEKSSKLSTKYGAVLKQAQDIFGKEVIVDLSIDGHGLLLDCEYAGVFGNYTFFKDQAFQYRFDKKLEDALDLAVRQGYATARSPFTPVDFDYKSMAAKAGVAFERPQLAEVASLVDDPYSQVVEKGTLATFDIAFKPNQVDFPIQDYREDFERAIQQASLAPSAVIVVRGHSDPTQTLLNLIKAGMAKSLIRRSGKELFIKTTAGWKPLDLTQTKNLVTMIDSGAFGSATPNPMTTMQAALTLSDHRAANVQRGIMSFAQQQGVTVNEKQIQPVGVGILDPVVAKPITEVDRGMNRRVEVRVVEVPGEMGAGGDVEY